MQKLTPILSNNLLLKNISMFAQVPYRGFFEETIQYFKDCHHPNFKGEQSNSKIFLRENYFWKLEEIAADSKKIPTCYGILLSISITLQYVLYTHCNVQL